MTFSGRTRTNVTDLRSGTGGKASKGSTQFLVGEAMRSLGLPTGACVDQRELITEKTSSISENLRISVKNHKQPGGSPAIVSLTQQLFTS